MTILDCASKAACGPSIDHCHGTSSRNLNAPVQVQHFALGVVELHVFCTGAYCLNSIKGMLCYIL